MTFFVVVCAALVAGAFYENVKVNEEKETFVYVNKFNFDTSGMGLINISALSISNPQDVSMALYFDERWLNVYDNKTMNCADKLFSGPSSTQTWASRVTPLTDIMDIMKKSKTGSYEVIVSDTMRPHFWYIALASCNTSKITNFQYTVMFTQNQTGMYHQVSYDKQSLFYLYAFFMIVWLILVGVNVVSSIVLIRRQAFHPIVRIFTFSIVVYLFSLICGLIHESIYARNGVGTPGLAGFGQFLDYLSDVVFMLLLMLLAQGWAISRQTIDHRNAMLIGAALFLVLYIVLILVATYGLNDAYTVFVFATVPGIMLVVLRSLLGVVFVLFAVRTMKSELPADKMHFFRVLLISYVIYLAALPLIVLLSSALEYWYSFKVTMWLYAWVKLFGLGLMVVLLSPNYAEKNFAVSAPSQLVQGGFEKL